jgi:hypothetical protein
MEYAALVASRLGWKQAGFKLKLSGDPADLQSVSEQRVVVPLLTVLARRAALASLLEIIQVRKDGYLHG